MAIESLIKEMPPKQRERLAFTVAAVLGLVALLWGLNVYVLRGHRIDRAAARKAEHALVQQLRNGDLIFQISTSGQSKAIQLATHSKYSHCGLVFQADTGARPWLVLEAAGTVQWTPLAAWIANGQDGHFVVKRLSEADAMDERGLAELRIAAERHVGKDYDAQFAWSDERIYCSELIWKAYHESAGLTIGALQQLRAFDLSHPVVASKLMERYGDQVPLDEPVISPAAVYESPLLITVGSAGQ